MTGAQGPWWIIGSAAVTLHGADVTVADVDVLLGEADARVVLSALGVTADAGEGTALFRSAVFGRWDAPPLTVEFMAGFRFRASGGWRAVSPVTRERVVVDGHPVFVPAKAELVSLLHGFGRDKDLERAALLA